MTNIFNNPQKYIDEIYDKIKIDNLSIFEGKSMAVVFLTKFCPVECPFCFFHSKQKNYEEVSEINEFSKDGINKLIDFLNYVNLETLEISGGGEPFDNFAQLIHLLEKVKTDKIIIVTSGYWAKNKEQTNEILNTIYQSIAKRKDNVDVTLRLSVDKFHSRKVDLINIKNIIDYFDTNHNNLKSFNLKIHTIEKDNTIFQYLKNNVSLIKNNKNFIVKTANNYSFEIEIAKLFYSNLKINLNNTNELNRAKDVFAKDIENSPLNNFSIYKDSTGKFGLDFLINYSGNVTTWGNYHINNIPNIYKDNKIEIMKKLYKEPISYSFLTLPYYERDSIIREINEKAADRAIGINIRDYSGAYLLQEKDTLLYYQLTIIKQFIQKGIIDKNSINLLSDDIKNTIKLNNEKIKLLYKKSNYDILKQLNEQKYVDDIILNDTFDLIKNGHYNIKNKEINKNLLINKHIDNKNQSERLLGYLNNSFETTFINKAKDFEM